MQRDFDKITNQLETLCEILEQKANNNQYITLGDACKQAKISHSWICQIIDASETFQIPSHLIERYEIARSYVYDVIIQEVNGIGLDRYEQQEDENGVTKPIYADTPMKIARSKLKLDSMKWLYSRLMPRLLGDKMTVDSNILPNQNNTLVYADLSKLPLDVLRMIAKTPIPIEDKSN
jgi:hypothetical protein